MRYYFVSDVHLGLDIPQTDSRQRQRVFVRWLECVHKQLLISKERGEECGLFLLGDIFDFWFEYRHVAPKGFIRVLAAIAAICDDDIEVSMYVGNHDTWCYNYLQEELGIKIYKEQRIITLGDKKALVCHGHRLKIKNQSLSYRLMTWFFNSPVVCKIYSTIVHPDLSLFFGSWWSRCSRKSKSSSHVFVPDKEYSVAFANEYLKKDHVDMFIMGHFHTPIIYSLSNNSTLIILGQWIDADAREYLVVDDNGQKMCNFTDDNYTKGTL